MVALAMIQPIMSRTRCPEGRLVGGRSTSGAMQIARMLTTQKTVAAILIPGVM
jgi:hypothetical protein